MQFILNWPPAISFLIVSVMTTSVALLGLRFVRKKYPAEVLKENHEVAAIIFNAFGLLYGVVVAFVVFVTWSGYDEATKSLQMEASEALDIFHSAEGFPDPANKIIQQALRDYVASVYNDELKRISQGEISLYSSGPHAKLKTLFYQLDQKSIPNKELSVSFTYFLGVKNIRAQYFMTAALTVTITMILVLIYILDHPFTGASSVSAEPLRQAMDVMQRDYQPAVTQ